MELRVVDIADLKEADVNAQVMAPKDFDRLTENIRTRGQMESLPYVAQPPGSDELRIVSGHHRTRAAGAAGLTRIPILVDTSALTRSQITAKQIAHNQLVGLSDEAIIRELLKELESVDDFLETGLPEEFLPGVATDSPPILMPHADFDWRTMSFVFLPHQLDDFRRLLDTLDGQQEIVAVAPRETFEAFARAVSQFQRIKEIRSAGTAVALLTELALEKIEEANDRTPD